MPGVINYILIQPIQQQKYVYNRIISGETINQKNTREECHTEEMAKAIKPL